MTQNSRFTGPIRSWWMNPWSSRDLVALCQVYSCFHEPFQGGHVTLHRFNTCFAFDGSFQRGHRPLDLFEVSRTISDSSEVNTPPGTWDSCCTPSWKFRDVRIRYHLITSIKYCSFHYIFRSIHELSTKMSHPLQNQKIRTGYESWCIPESGIFLARHLQQYGTWLE